MKIGIIGAGIAGLAAGRELVKAGHDVTVIEKNKIPGGRLAAIDGGADNHICLDYGASYLTATSPEFRGFVSELLGKQILKVWGDHIRRYESGHLHDRNPNTPDQTLYTAPEGTNRISKYLSRWLDIRIGEQAGGLTFLGANRGRKRAWMVNLTNFNTFEADAVIIATPAPVAYGILLTSQDEVNILKLIREIDEIHYEPSFALMASYGDIQIPEWDAISCRDSVIRFISNENSKRDLPETSLVVHSTAEFARTHLHQQSEPDEQVIADKMLEHLSTVTGNWSSSPVWHQVHEWRFARPSGIIRRPWMEYESEDSPLAVVGDYFEESGHSGDDMDRAYRSGVTLAKHWINKYKDRKIQILT